MTISRAERSIIGEWWFTVDRTMLGAIAMIVMAGLVLSLAASPAIAIKKGLPTYYFVERHVLFSLAGLVVMLWVSLFSPAGVRRLALLVLLLATAGLVLVLVSGSEINGARRWLSIGSHSLQPSEFAKPAFVVVCAWFFAEARLRPDMPALAFASLLALLMTGLLLAEPDVGQTVLLILVWGTLYFLSGQPIIGAFALAGLTGAGLWLAYLGFPHVQLRVDRFLAPPASDTSQVERAMRSFSEGGFLGRGPGEGTIKTVLPDAHNDFIFAVVAEEYGVVACLALLVLFAFVVLRAFAAAEKETEPATRLAIQGLATLLGLQALINMSVNAGLLPAKGMPLPFISAGGSAMLGFSVGLGMLLALSRRRADPARLKKPRLIGIMGAVEPGSRES